ncbi:MAG: ABC transporter permease subunit [Alphaproteobacteria bacterium]|nr:ABC transporter permease subunit [Alphaproteobacteria bacterium]
MAGLAHPKTAPSAGLDWIPRVWNNRLVRTTLYQAVLFGGVIWMFAYFTGNAVENMARLGITSGYGFLDRPANLPIGEGIIAYTPADSYGRAILVGLLNTFKVTIIGCVLVTILGVTLGIMRLSPNPLLSGLVQTYIEVIRNTPLLLQLFFWYVIVRQLPAPRQAFNPLDGVFISNRGVQIPWLEADAGLWWIASALGLAILGSLAYRRMAMARQARTGEFTPVLPLALVLLLVLPALAAWLFSVPIIPTIPELKGFNFVGGTSLTPEFTALLTGLTMYTIAFVAEIVRSGVQSVAHGQWEAARSLGLRDRRILRLIILPQALRVIVPPMTSTYLNYAKNSSLAVAIGYPDLVSVVNTTMNQTGQSVETIAILMAVYLSISLSISAFMNWYNRRIALTER